MESCQRVQLSSTLGHSLQTTIGVWRVKLLLIIALGKLFLEKGATAYGPPGMQEFLQGVHDLSSNIILAESR